ncbi:MAG: hypothetical protein P8Y12_12440 [Gammaproteobacteria bacterium]|jgi:hypothetical protein
MTTVAANVDPDLAMVIKRMLDNGDLNQAEAELVWGAIATPVFGRCLVKPKTG